MSLAMMSKSGMAGFVFSFLQFFLCIWSLELLSLSVTKRISFSSNFVTEDRKGLSLRVTYLWFELLS